MKKTTLLLSLILSISLYCNAAITWEKLFVQSNTDVFRSVQEVPAGGYIAAGYTSHWSANDTDAYVVRLNVDGDTLWTRTFNGGKRDVFYKVINTSDGGFVMCGYSSSYSGVNATDDAYYMKIDANGNELWHFTYGGTNSKDRAQEIIQTSDGGYAMCGYTNNGTGAQGYNAFLVKIDANGGQTWAKKYGTLLYDDANSLKELSYGGGGFILAGQTVAPDTTVAQIYLIRTNLNGDTCWTRRIGTTSNGATENADYIQLVPSGGFIICGLTSDTVSIGHGSDDGYLLKTDTGGVIVWQKAFGGSLPDDFHRVENTSDGGFIVTGTSQSNAQEISNQWLFKTNANGDSTWAYTFGGANHDHAYSVAQTLDGGYVFCGYTASFGFNYEDALIIKVDGNGLLYNHLFYTTVTALVTPQNNTCGSANSVVTITVRNFGDTAVSSIRDTVVITGAINQTLAQTFIGNLSPPNFINHTISTTINTSAGGVFNFHCFTSTSNDVYPAMNSYDSTITLLGIPSSPTTVNDTSCGPGSLTLTASGSGILSWYTSATGGTFLTSASTYNTPVITNTTTYYVQDSSGCGASARTAVTAVIVPVSADPNVVSAQRCGPGSITLMASASDPLSWWDSASGGVMLQGDFNNYVVTVSTTTAFYVQAGTTCPSNRIAVTATVNPLPDASFTPSAPAVCLGDDFVFTNNSTGAAGSFWDFGDATGTSIQTNPTYTYAATGSYNVQLVAVTNLFCYDTVVVTVGVNTAPVVSFSVASTSGCAPYTVNFINTTTNATDYLWSFGDGVATSTQQNPTYTYNTPGTYTVSLNATVGSCADADTIANYITVSPSPTANFSANNACLGDAINFTNSSTGATSYDWDFGDAIGTSTQTDPSYTYTSANTFTVTLVASDGTCTDTLTQSATAYALPIVDLGIDVATASVVYVLDAGAGFTSYLWNNAATTQTITVDTDGTYCVTVTDNNTCSNSDCVNVLLDVMSVEAISGENDFIIYPNPAKDQITIQSMQNVVGGVLKIVDLTGKEVLATKLIASNFNLQLSNMESGIYFIEIQSADYKARRKLIVY